MPEKPKEWNCPSQSETRATVQGFEFRHVKSLRYILDIQRGVLSTQLDKQVWSLGERSHVGDARLVSQDVEDI